LNVDSDVAVQKLVSLVDEHPLDGAAYRHCHPDDPE
jgi:hypothetical protein